MIGADRDSHRTAIVLCGSGSRFDVQVQGSVLRFAGSRTLEPGSRSACDESVSRHLRARRGARRERPSVDLSRRRRRGPRGGRRHRGRAQPARTDARPGALQRSVADRAPHARRSATSRPTTALIGRRLDAAIAVPRSAGDRRDGVPARARRSRPAAVAHRRSLRRLSRRADAVAGHGPAAAAGRGDARPSRCSRKGILARNDPRTRLLEGLEQRVEVLAGDVPESVACRRERHRVRRRPAARPEDRPVPRPAREPRGRRALRAAAACSTASATTAALR